jgi:molybdenum cofactor cytidylyltransferase
MGRPKMPLPWGDTTVIGQVVKVLLAAGVDEVVVVVGGAQEMVRIALREFPARIVFNPDYANGEMVASLQVGLRALPKDVEAALVVLGDQPQIKEAIVQDLIACYQQNEPDVLIPSYQMRRGHPWLIKRRLWQGVLNLSSPQTLRDFLRAQADQVQYLVVDSPTILQDLDSPNDYQRFRPE